MKSTQPENQFGNSFQDVRMKLGENSEQALILSSSVNFLGVK